MLVQISGKGFELSSELRDHVEERVSTALDRFTDRIARVNVFLADENGPKNGLDKSLRLIIDIERLPLIVVEERGESWYAASTERQSEPFMLSAAKSTAPAPGPITLAWRAMEVVPWLPVWNSLELS